MTIYTFPLSDTTSIKLYNVTDDMAMVQYYSPDKKSRKSACKIKEYKGKKYVNCLGHRYYLEKFQRVDI